MIKSKLRGNDIEIVNDEWIYSKTGISTLKYTDIPCGYCDKLFTKEGHDFCLGSLPFITNACCGHGIISEAYVQLFNFLCIRGKFAKIIIYILKFIKRSKETNDTLQ